MLAREDRQTLAKHLVYEHQQGWKYANAPKPVLVERHAVLHAKSSNRAAVKKGRATHNNTKGPRTSGGHNPEEGKAMTVRTRSQSTPIAKAIASLVSQIAKLEQKVANIEAGKPSRTRKVSSTPRKSRSRKVVVVAATPRKRTRKVVAEVAAPARRTRSRKVVTLVTAAPTKRSRKAA